MKMVKKGIHFGSKIVLIDIVFLIIVLSGRIARI